MGCDAINISTDLVLININLFASIIEVGLVLILGDWCDFGLLGGTDECFGFFTKQNIHPGRLGSVFVASLPSLSLPSLSHKNPVNLFFPQTQRTLKAKTRPLPVVEVGVGSVIACFHDNM